MKKRNILLYLASITCLITSTTSIADSYAYRQKMDGVESNGVLGKISKCSSPNLTETRYDAENKIRRVNSYNKHYFRWDDVLLGSVSFGPKILNIDGKRYIVGKSITGATYGDYEIIRINDPETYDYCVANGYI